MSIAEALLEKGLISTEQLAQAMALRKKESLRLDRALLRLGCLTEEDLLAVMSEQLAIPTVDLADVEIDVETLRSLPSRLVYRKHMVPVARDNGSLTVATCNPFDLYAFDEIRLLTGLEVRPALAAEADIAKVIKTHYGVGGETLDEMMSTDDLEVVSESADDGDDLLEMAQEASVIKLVNEIFLEALNERASDIHVEPFEKTLKIKFRVDSILHEREAPPKKLQPAIVSRIKIMAGMNIAERFVPQDGHINFHATRGRVDIRVATVPTIFGECVVMRLLDRSTGLIDLERIGMTHQCLDPFVKLLERPHGILLVTGPTGSGKTTTLYAALNRIYTP